MRVQNPVQSFPPRLLDFWSAHILFLALFSNIFFKTAHLDWIFLRTKPEKRSFVCVDVALDAPEITAAKVFVLSIDPLNGNFSDC